MSFKVSIIIPVYNAVPYINKCLDSIANQTLKDIEVILVDDHGYDNSIAIVQQYINEHQLNTWKIVATPHNSGPGIARNVGMHHATGEYIAFCDADDWIEPTMYEQLYTQANIHSAEISSAAAVLDYLDGTHLLMTNPEIGSGFISHTHRKYILSHFISNFTTILFLREWLNHYLIAFPNARSGEDSSFMGQCYLVAKQIAQTSKPLYHYVIHSDSISHSKRVWRGREKRKAFNALIHFAKRNNLWQSYRKELILIYIKKALLAPIKEWLH